MKHDSEFWQRRICRNWNKDTGCAAGETDCDACTSFDRIHVQYCEKCGEAFIDKKSNYFCHCCRASIQEGDTMKNTLSDLNNYLFESLERLMDDDLDEEGIQKEITRSQAVTNVAEAVIKNGELALKTMKHLNEYGYTIKNSPDKGLAPVPPMLEVHSGS